MHKAFFEEAYATFGARVQQININTGAKLELTKREVLSLFAPKIVLLNHEKRLNVDIPCQNLSVKYNMLYLSVYQLIREHIEGNTEWGQRLQRERKQKEMTMNFQQKDDLME